MTQLYSFLRKPVVSSNKFFIHFLLLILLLAAIHPAQAQNLIRNGGADTVPVLNNPTYNFWSRVGGGANPFGYDASQGGDWYLQSSNTYYAGGSQSGPYFFNAGNTNNPGVTDQIIQTTDLSGYANVASSFSFNGYVSLNSGFDQAEMIVSYYDASSTVLYQFDTVITSTGNGYSLIMNFWNMPAGTALDHSQVVLSAYSGGVGNIQVFYDGLSLVNGPILPLDLLDFTAIQKPDNTVGLLWHTAQEENSNFIEVQRSSDGTNFTPIGQVPAAGNSKSIKEYTLIDKSPIAGNGFYRLRLVDLDATFKYSKVVEVRSSGSDKTLEVFNNPFYDQLGIKISTGAADKLTLTLSDMSGRVYLRQAYNTEAGNNFINMYPSVGIAKGVYLLNVKGTNTNQTVKVLKQQ